MPPHPNDRNSGKEERTEKIVKSRSLDEPVGVGFSNLERPDPEKRKSVSGLVDELLSEIYGKAELKRKQSVTTGGEWSWHESDQRNRSNQRFRSNLKQIEAKCWSKDVEMLKEEISALESLIADESNNLVKYLKRKDFLIARREAHYDVITAVIHAISRKTRDDMKMKFSLTPGTETGFSQWLDAMKMVAQLPGGVPSEFRTKLWLQLSERHLSEENIDWEKAEAIIFNEWTNPDDEELGVQIVKDLHRTGCSLFCGAQEQNQALLKRVLLAYARWNKNVGYCQGFNMLAALILQVMDRDEKNAVKVMIYLIEGVLPESYFANNLRGLSVDMAVFRDLLRLRLPKLSKHLEALQNDTNSGTSYEPPLTNVFTMQWFLTLFSNCLPQQTVLRVWDLVFLHGNEVLLRTALAIWGILQDRIMSVESADEFYSIMGVVTREMLEFGLMDANNLIKMIVMVDPFPNELQELREKYLYNISPWTQSVQSAARKGIKLFYSDPEDQDDTEDEDKIALATAYGVFRRRESGSRDVQPMGPTLDISVLKQQYAKLRQRQRQAHIIISAACSSSLPANLSSVPTVSVNHLLMGKSALVNKGRRIGPPEGSIPPPKNRAVKANEAGKQYGRKEKVVISGETLDWKDAEKRKCSKTESKKLSNTDGKLAINKSKTKSMESCNGLNKEGGHFGVDEGRMKRRNSTSSASSTSTELCDDEFNRLSDFDGEESNPDRESEKHDSSQCRNQFVADEPSETGRYEEARECAAELVRDIEEAVDRSQRLRHLKNSAISDSSNRKAEDEMTSNHDNIIFKSPDFGGVEEEFLKTEPEVPIAGDVIDNAENRIFDRSKRDSGPGESTPEAKSRRERDRRKSDLALSVIKENLEMLSKFSQKSAAKEERKEKGVESRGGEEEKMIEEVKRIEPEKDVGKDRESVMRGAERPDHCVDELITEEANREVQVCGVREEIRPRDSMEVWEKEDQPKGVQTTVKREEESTISNTIREREEIVNKEIRPGCETVMAKWEEEKPMVNVAADFREEEDRKWRETMAVKWEEESRKSIIREVNEKSENRSGSEATTVRQEEERLKTVVSKGVRGKEERRSREATAVKAEEKRPLRDEMGEVEGMEERQRSGKIGVKREERVNNDASGEIGKRKDGRKSEITELKGEENGEQTGVNQNEVQRREERRGVEPMRVKWEEKGGSNDQIIGEVQEKARDRSRSEKMIKSEEITVSDVMREAQGRENRDESETGGVKSDEERPKIKVVTEVEEKENGPKREGKEINRDKISEKTDLFGDNFRTREEPVKATEEKAISRVNKEVNTDITIATDLESSPGRNSEGTNNQGKVEEFLINLISIKSLQKSPDRLKPEKRGFVGEKDSEKVRSFGRDDLAERWKKESERIESKIEMSKSDWELKMRRIAELENTTMEKLNEIKSKSIVHRHRSLDRYDRREGERRKSPIPRIQVPEDDSENLEKRKMKISALSFDEITSRTEKLLGENLNLDSSGYRKFRKSFEEDGDEGGGGKSYEYYSSPTSPECRGRKRSDYFSPKRYEGRWKISQPAEEDWLTITEESGRGTRVDLVSPGRKSEKDQSPIGGFNPFPTRIQSRPKELGVRLGMYPPSPEDGHHPKKSH